VAKPAEAEPARRVTKPSVGLPRPRTASTPPAAAAKSKVEPTTKGKVEEPGAVTKMPFQLAAPKTAKAQKAQQTQKKDARQVEPAAAAKSPEPEEAPAAASVDKMAALWESAASRRRPEVERAVVVEKAARTIESLFDRKSEPARPDSVFDQPPAETGRPAESVFEKDRSAESIFDREIPSEPEISIDSLFDRKAPKPERPVESPFDRRPPPVEDAVDLDASRPAPEPDMFSPPGMATGTGPSHDSSDVFLSRRLGQSDSDGDAFTSFKPAALERLRAEHVAQREAERANRARAAGDWSEHAVSPENKAAKHFENGLTSLRKGEYQSALEQWEAATALDPDNRVYQTNLRRLKQMLLESRPEGIR